MEWQERDEVRWLQAPLPGATAAFSTRIGGVSDEPWDTLNLGLLTGDRAENVARNRARLAAALGLEPDRVVIGRQVHGAELAGYAGPQSPSPFAAPGSCDPPEVDGHHTVDPGLALLVFVADCLPIAVAGDRGVAMLHGGWRGLAGGIVARGVDAVAGRAAAIGPGIGPCCYEVGPEVLDAFAPLGPEITNGRQLDLTAVAILLLEAAGVEQVVASDLCTQCNPELFFSHRGQGPDTGRQGGLVWSTG